MLPCGAAVKTYSSAAVLVHRDKRDAGHVVRRPLFAPSTKLQNIASGALKRPMFGSTSGRSLSGTPIQRAIAPAY